MRAPGLLAIPRDANPYQERLYEQLRHAVRVRYAGCITPSRTANLLILPSELAYRRLAGYRILHIHWVFGFAWPGHNHSSVVRRLGRWWFVITLMIARLLRFRIVWTAHNVLPHVPVFDDDVRARRTLVRNCALVIVHTDQALSELDAIGATPARFCVIPHGPMTEPGRFRNLATPGSHGRRSVLFFGRVAPYKGVHDLLIAARSVPRLHITVAGSCDDAAYQRLIEAEASRARQRVSLRLSRIPDEDLVQLFDRADALVFPFLAVTTSGSLLMGMASGRPIVIPDLPSLAHLPEKPVIRYQPGVQGLRAALDRVANAPASELAEKGEAARASAFTPSWTAIGAETLRCLTEVKAQHITTIANDAANLHHYHQ